MMDVKKLAEIAGQKDQGPLTIQRQISLQWSDAIRISLRNVTLRLGRAAITGLGVVLGIAFLMSVWTSRVCQDGIENAKKQSSLSVAADNSPGAKVAAEEVVARTARQNWLVIMSLLVCMVGITNSMLMSVTERFREIGTMKCLGALDSFIVRLFLIETAFLGLFGSIVGIIIGHVIMLVVFTLKDHSVAAKMNWPHMLMYMGMAMGIGVLVSLVAAVPPAMSAAKMPPAAALATEI